MLYMGYIKLLTTEITGVICCNTFFMFHSHCHLKNVLSHACSYGSSLCNIIHYYHSFNTPTHSHWWILHTWTFSLVCWNMLFWIEKVHFNPVCNSSLIVVEMFHNVLLVSDMRYSQQWKFKLWLSWLWHCVIV